MCFISLYYFFYILCILLFIDFFFTVLYSLQTLSNISCSIVVTVNITSGEKRGNKEYIAVTPFIIYPIYNIFIYQLLSLDVFVICIAIFLFYIFVLNMFLIIMKLSMLSVVCNANFLRLHNYYVFLLLYCIFYSVYVLNHILCYIISFLYFICVQMLPML